MLDINKRKNLSGLTLNEVIHELSQLPGDALFFCCGDDSVYLHVEEDNSCVSIDWSELEEHYQENS